MHTLNRSLKQADADDRAEENDRALRRSQAEQLRLHSKTWNIINNTALAEIDQFDGDTFEYYVVVLMSVLGYSNVKKTQASNDYGVDVVCEKDGIRYGIQCKRYKGAVGRDAVQQVASGLNHYHCNKGIVITNSTFTRNARTLAQENDVLLIDRQKMIQLIKLCQSMGRYEEPLPSPNHAQPAAPAKAPYHLKSSSLAVYDRSRDWNDLSQGRCSVLLPAGRYTVGLDIPNGRFDLTGNDEPCAVWLLAPDGQTERDSQTVNPDSAWRTILQHGEILEVNAPGVKLSKAAVVVSQ